jgi:PAS domain S-box-containing protein
MRRKILGLGDNSVHKTHYPSLRQRLVELERVRAELLQSEAYLLEAQRLSRTGSFGWRISTGEILWSEETFRIFQYDPATKPTVDMILQRVHPDDLVHVRQTIERASSDGTFFDHEYRLLMPDGSVRYVHAVAHAAGEATGSIEFVGAVMDVTERNKAIVELARLGSIVASSDDAIISTDLDGRVTSWNAGAAQIFGYDENEVVGQSVSLIIPSELQTDEMEILARLQRGERIGNYETVRVAKDGRRIDISVTVSPLHDKLGKVIGISTIGTDITERKQAAKLQAELHAELAHLARVTTLGELTASIAHEVSQPIGAARNNTNAALNFLDRNPPDLEEVREALSCVVSDTDRASDVIGRIRDLIKKAPHRVDRLDINDVIRVVIELTRAEAAMNGVLLLTELADGLPLVRGDRIELQQVILNLIINALEAMRGTSEGARELLISSARANSEVLVTVRDSGPGLPATGLERLFEPFHTTKPTGLGMGLSICRSIIQAHGGRLSASANVPRGAIFQFTLLADAGSTS